MNRYGVLLAGIVALVLADACDASDGSPPVDTRDALLDTAPDAGRPTDVAGGEVSGDADAAPLPDAPAPADGTDAATDGGGDGGDTGPSWPAARPLPAPPEDPEPAWILLDADLDRARSNIDAAVTAGIETVQLSHDLIMAPEDVLADAARLERLNAVAAYAKERGLSVLLWSHEIEGDVTLDVCFDPADPLWEARRQAYRDLLDAVPQADGIVLMFGSAKLDPFYALCTCEWCEERAPEGALIPAMETPPAADRVEQLLRLVAGVVEGERGKRLVLRTFIHQPAELVAVGEGLDRATDLAFDAMSKDVPQDWQPYYPQESLIGRYPERRHVMELDAAGEYWGQSALPFAAVGYFHRRMLDALERGIDGFAARVERGSHGALGTPNEVNLFTAARLLADPSVPPAELWAEWIAARYGLAAGSPESATLARVLARTEEIGRRTFYNLGFWALRKGSDPPDACRSAELLTGRSNTKWDPDPGWVALDAELHAPTPATLASLAQEKHEAAVLAAANLAELEAVAGALAPDDAADLRDRLTRQAAAVDAWAAVTEVVWGYQLWRDTGDEEHAAWLESALRRLEGLAADIPARLADPWPVEPENLAACAADVRGTFRGSETPVDRPQPFLEPPALAPCAPDLCVTVSASEPLRLALRFGWHLPFPEVLVAGPSEPVATHTFRVPPLPAGRWAVLRAEAAWSEGTLLGGDVWVWPAEAFAAAE